jgi:hypothetical protein
MTTRLALEAVACRSIRREHQMHFWGLACSCGQDSQRATEYNPLMRVHSGGAVV